MPAIIILWLERAGVAERFRKPLAYLAGVVFFAIVVSLIWLAWHHWLQGQREDAVSNYQANVNAAVATKVDDATNDADAAAIMHQEVFNNAQQELHDEVKAKGTSDSVGPGTRAVLERMRAQQAAGRRSTAKPSCNAADVRC